METQNLNYRGYPFRPRLSPLPCGVLIASLSVFTQSKSYGLNYGVTVGYEAVRRWCLPCARCFAKRLRHNRLSYTADGRYDPQAQDTRRHA
jgi:hypothetical protein